MRSFPLGIVQRSVSFGFLFLIVLTAGVSPTYAGGLIVDTVLNSSFPLDGLGGPVQVAVSPDGLHVYVVGDGGDSLAVADSLLAGLLDAEFDGVAGVNELRTPSGVVVSPDGAHVYVTAEDDDAVSVFSRNGGTGEVTFVEAEKDGVGGVDNLREASGVAISPDGAHVYVTSEQDHAVSLFARDTVMGPTFGQLTYVESYVDDALGVDGLRRAQSVAVSPDGAHIYVASGGGVLPDDAIAVFSRQTTPGPNFGKLTFVEAERDGDVRVPFDVTVSGDGGSVYVAGLVGNTVAAFSRNETPGPGFGELTVVEVEKDGGEVNGLNGAASVRVSVDGAHVFVAGRGDHAVAVFRRDASSHKLTFLEAEIQEVTVDGLRQASGLAVNPLFSTLYVAANNGMTSLPSSGAVVSFFIDSCGNSVIGPDEPCDDGNLMSGDGCSSTCRLEICPPAPVLGCDPPTQPRKSVLTIKDDAASDGKDKLKWKWSKGPSTPIGDFDDPAVDASYVLCVYDGSGGTQPRLGSSVPPGQLCDGDPCWSASSTTKWKYKDKQATPDGVTKVLLKSGTVPGTAKIGFQGKGSNLFFVQPTSGSLLAPSGLTLPVTVQLLNDDTATSACWEAVFSTATANDGEQFKAKSD